MKKLLILFVMSVAAFSISCSDDDISNNTLTQLVGTWSPVSTTLNGEEQPSTDECGMQSTMTFSANGGYVSNIFSDNEQSDGCSHSIVNGSWTNNGNNVTLTVPAGSETYLFEFPDENTLKITDTNEPGYVGVNILTRLE